MLLSDLHTLQLSRSVVVQRIDQFILALLVAEKLDLSFADDVDVCWEFTLSEDELMPLEGLLGCLF